MRLEDYCTKAPLKADFEALCDPALDFGRDRDEVNGRVMNLAIKYLKAYLGIETEEAGQLKKEVGAHLEEARPKCGPGLYALMSHHYGPDISGTHDTVHEFPLRCLTDIRATAAIFKEIAFNGEFGKAGRFVGVDLGAGTGILMVALVIAARRQGISEVFCAGAEIRELAVKKARVALRKTLGNSHILKHVDLMKENNLRSFLKKFPPRYWVSETISDTTPSLDPQRSDLGRPNLKTAYRVQIERADDPFVELLSGTLEQIPDFSDRVAKGETAMFPNVVNGTYKPDGENSTILLKTGLGIPLLLHELGKEFEAYEDLGTHCRRWAKKD